MEGSVFLRLFFAVPVDPPPPVVRLLDHLAGFRPHLRPVAADRLHLTLRFLGDIDARRVGALRQALQRAVVAARTGAVDWPLTGVETFPNGAGARPRVIFARSTEVADESLYALAGALGDQLGALTPPVPEEKRPFTAHLTLARRRMRRGRKPMSEGTGRELSDLLAKYRDRDLGTVRIESIHLIASALSSDGPEYRSLKQVNLRG